MKLDIQKFATQPANISISTTSITLGGSATITLTPHLSTNRYRLILQTSSYSIILVDNLSGNTYTFNPSIDLANYITNSPSVNATIKCETYYGTTAISSSLIGRTTKAIVLNVPYSSTTKPTISISSIQEGNSTMTSLNWGVYVQNHSQLKINFSSSGKFNATIKKIKITADGTTYSYDYNDASVSTNKTTDIITTSGSKTITVEATDSRGFTNSTTSSAVTINAYSNPQFTTPPKVERTGTNNDQVKYTFKASTTNVGSANKNAHTFKMAYKLRSASTYSGETTIENSSYSVNKVDQVISGWSLSSDNTYDIRFTATDSFTTSTQVLELSSEGDLLNFNASGKAMAIGKVSEATGNNKLLEIAVPTTIIGTGNMLKVYGSTVSTDAMIEAKRTDTNRNVRFGVGAGGTNRGIYDDYLNKWVVYSDDSNSYFNGHATSATNSTNATSATNSTNSTYSNLTISKGRCGSDTSGTNGWYKVCSGSMTGYANQVMTWLVRDNYPEAFDNNGNYHSKVGIYHLNVRGNNGSLAIWAAKWLVRDGFKEDDIRVVASGTTWTLYVNRVRSQYGRISFTPIASTNINGESYIPTYYDSTTKESSTPIATKASTDSNFVSLYDNSSGTTGNVTLSETSADFKYLEIFYWFKDNTSRTSTKVYSPNGKNVQLQASYDNGTRLYTSIGVYAISGTSITKSSEARWRFGTGGENNTRTNVTSSDSSIYIYKVIGYR